MEKDFGVLVFRITKNKSMKVFLDNDYVEFSMPTEHLAIVVSKSGVVVKFACDKYAVPVLEFSDKVFIQFRKAGNQVACVIQAHKSVIVKREGAVKKIDSAAV